MTVPFLRIATLGALALGLGATAADAQSQRTTTLLSRAHHGGFPNGPSRAAVVSHDQRIARYMAFESDASDIVTNDGNGTTDVFVVPRAAPYGRNGTPWAAGPTQIASRRADGAAANGRSWGASLDGDSHHSPRCVAFVSEATDLVPRDTNGVADAFVRRLDTGRIRRVSVDSQGRQANGATTAVSVDGSCERVAMATQATNLHLRRTKRLEWRESRSGRARKGTSQIVVKVIGGHGPDAAFRGLTFLASANNHHTAGNGQSTEPRFAPSGKFLVFTSTSTNLGRAGGVNVYRVAFTRLFRRWRELNNRGANQLHRDIRLVSATRAGNGGNGASTHPSVTDDGRFVAFQTLAGNLIPGDVDGWSDIVRTDMKNPRRPKHREVSRSAFSGEANGPSFDPMITDAGDAVVYASNATNLKPSAAVADDRNGQVADVFFWNGLSGNVSLESRDSDNGYLRQPSSAPATSSRVNYVPFESVDTLIDKPFVSTLYAKAQARDTELRATPLEEFLQQIGLLPKPGPAPTPPKDPLAGLFPTGAKANQVYLRYLGPK